MYTFSFEKLDVWKNSKEFILDIYLITNKFPTSENYGIVSQIKRSSSSIATNIAEGTSRNTKKKQGTFSNHFIFLSDGNFKSFDNF